MRTDPVRSPPTPAGLGYAILASAFVVAAAVLTVYEQRYEVVSLSVVVFFFAIFVLGARVVGRENWFPGRRQVTQYGVGTTTRSGRRPITVLERRLEAPSRMSYLELGSGRPIRRRIEWTPACVPLVVLGSATGALHGYIGLRLGKRHFPLLGAGLFAGDRGYFHRVLETGLAPRRRYLHHGVARLLAARRDAVVPVGLVDGLVQLALIAMLFYHFLNAYRRRVA